METPAQLLNQAVSQAILEATGQQAEAAVTLSQSEQFGDYQSNAAMGLAKALSARGEKTAPRPLAQRIVEKLHLGDMAQEVTIAGAGFINVRLSPAWIAGQLVQQARDSRLGIDRPQERPTVVVDYSGPNVAKQMHVGHLRSTIIGDALSRILEFSGWRVIRQNHIGDWGTQFGMLIALLGQREDRETKIADLEEFYKQAKLRFDADSAFADEARQTVVRLQGGDELTLALWRAIVSETRQHYLPLYQRLNVLLTEADERGESFYNPMLADVVNDLRNLGVAESSQGATVVFTEGHANPLIIEKSGGGYLYGTTDLAAIRYRVETLQAQRIVYTTDSRQAQHFDQVFQAARRAGWAGQTVLEHAPFGSILGEDNKPFKTRAGQNVKLKELLDEAGRRALELVAEKNPQLPQAQREQIAEAVAIGAVKYADLAKDRVSDYVFSFGKMLAMDGNTGPYLQYAYARICSIFRKAETDGSNVLAQGASPRLQSAHELALAKCLLRFADAVRAAARELKPHLLCAYLYELATGFSGFYENCPILQSEPPQRQERLLLAALTGRTLACGLDLLGIAHPEQM